MPSGTDWRFGLPANDTPANAPTLLVQSVEKICNGFFKAVDLKNYDDQAVCAAYSSGAAINFRRAMSSSLSMPPI